MFRSPELQDEDRRIEVGAKSPAAQGDFQFVARGRRGTPDAQPKSPWTVGFRSPELQDEEREGRSRRLPSGLEFVERGFGRMGTSPARREVRQPGSWDEEREDRSRRLPGGVGFLREGFWRDEESGTFWIGDAKLPSLDSKAEQCGSKSARGRWLPGGLGFVARGLEWRRDRRLGTTFPSLETPGRRKGESRRTRSRRLPGGSGFLLRGFGWTGERQGLDRGLDVAEPWPRRTKKGRRDVAGCPAVSGFLGRGLDGLESGTFWIGDGDVAEPGVPRRSKADRGRRLPSGVEFVERDLGRTGERHGLGSGTRRCRVVSIPGRRKTNRSRRKVAGCPGRPSVRCEGAATDS